MNVILSVNGVYKTYQTNGYESIQVLRGIDLEVGRGEILAITGESGVGKSTLLHIMGGLDRPTTGSVNLGDIPVFEMADAELARFRNKHIGFVFQFHHLLPEFTALENVAMPAFIQRIDTQEATKRAGELLAAVGLSKRLTHRPREMSGGEQQRVAFARALMNDPVLVLADEPSGNLDLKNSDSLHRLMWELVKEKGLTFVVVTHNRELAENADRSIEMVDGNVHQIP